MKKWEYKYVMARPSYNEEFNEQLNELGKEGWELVTITNEHEEQVFKRELIENQEIEMD